MSTEEPPTPPLDDRPRSPVAPLPVDSSSAKEAGLKYDAVVNDRRKLVAYIELVFGGAVVLLLVGFILAVMCRSLEQEPKSASAEPKPASAEPESESESESKSESKPVPKIEIFVPILVSLGAMAAFVITNGRRDLVPFQYIYQSKQGQMPAGVVDVAKHQFGLDD